MKKRNVIPAIIAMGFFAGCDWSSWCSCVKKDKTAATTEMPAQAHESAPASQEAEETHAMPEDHDASMAKTSVRHSAAEHVEMAQHSEPLATEEASKEENPMLADLEDEAVK